MGNLDLSLPSLAPLYRIAVPLGVILLLATAHVGVRVKANQLKGELGSAVREGASAAAEYERLRLDYELLTGAPHLQRVAEAWALTAVEGELVGESVGSVQ